MIRNTLTSISQAGKIAQAIAHFAAWKHALAHACGVVIVVMSLFYYWFAISDRYAIFLYDHLGAGPFDPFTVGRYLMTGLVASGVVLALYALSQWLIGRLMGLRFQVYTPPPWWSVWVLSVPVLLMGIAAITMTQNRPTLPLELAAAVTATTLAGLAVALMPGRLAAQQPAELAWLGLNGAGLVPMLLLVRAIELPGRSLATPELAYTAAIGGCLASVAGLILLRWLRARLGRPPVGAGQLLLAGLAVSYLLLPLAHYLFFTPPAYRYISAASNFFAFSPGVQVLSWAFTSRTAGTADVLRHQDGRHERRCLQH